MSKIFIKQIEEHVKLYRDSRTGIAWIENGKAGRGHSCHPNIDKSSSIRGMKQKGYWGRLDKCVQSHGFIYNIDSCVITDDFDIIAMEHCKCGGNHQIIIYPNGSKYWNKDRTPPKIIINPNGSKYWYKDKISSKMIEDALSK